MINHGAAEQQLYKAFSKTHRLLNICDFSMKDFEKEFLGLEDEPDSTQNYDKKTRNNSSIVKSASSFDETNCFSTSILTEELARRRKILSEVQWTGLVLKKQKRKLDEENEELEEWISEHHSLTETQNKKDKEFEEEHKDLRDNVEEQLADEKAFMAMLNRLHSSHLENKRRLNSLEQLWRRYRTRYKDTKYLVYTALRELRAAEDEERHVKNLVSRTRVNQSVDLSVKAQSLESLRTNRRILSLEYKKRKKELLSKKNMIKSLQNTFHNQQKSSVEISAMLKESIAFRNHFEKETKLLKSAFGTDNADEVVRLYTEATFQHPTLEHKVHDLLELNASLAARRAELLQKRMAASKKLVVPTMSELRAALGSRAGRHIETEVIVVHEKRDKVAESSAILLSAAEGLKHLLESIDNLLGDNGLGLDVSSSPGRSLAAIGGHLRRNGVTNNNNLGVSGTSVLATSATNTLSRQNTANNNNNSNNNAILDANSTSRVVDVAAINKDLWSLSPKTHEQHAILDKEVEKMESTKTSPSLLFSQPHTKLINIFDGVPDEKTVSSLLNRLNMNFNDLINSLCEEEPSLIVPPILDVALVHQGPRLDEDDDDDIIQKQKSSTESNTILCPAIPISHIKECIEDGLSIPFLDDLLYSLVFRKPRPNASPSEVIFEEKRRRELLSAEDKRHRKKLFGNLDGFSAKVIIEDDDDDFENSTTNLNEEDNEDILAFDSIVPLEPKPPAMTMVESVVRDHFPLPMLRNQTSLYKVSPCSSPRDKLTDNKKLNVVENTNKLLTDCDEGRIRFSREDAGNSATFNIDLLSDSDLRNFRNIHGGRNSLPSQDQKIDGETSEIDDLCVIALEANDEDILVETNKISGDADTVSHNVNNLTPPSANASSRKLQLQTRFEEDTIELSSHLMKSVNNDGVAVANNLNNKFHSNNLEQSTANGVLLSSNNSNIPNILTFNPTNNLKNSSNNNSNSFATVNYNSSPSPNELSSKFHLYSSATNFNFNNNPPSQTPQPILHNNQSSVYSPSRLSPASRLFSPDHSRDVHPAPISMSRARRSVPAMYHQLGRLPRWIGERCEADDEEDRALEHLFSGQVNLYDVLVKAKKFESDARFATTRQTKKIPIDESYSTNNENGFNKSNGYTTPTLLGNNNNNQPSGLSFIEVPVARDVPTLIAVATQRKPNQDENDSDCSETDIQLMENLDGPEEARLAQVRGKLSEIEASKFFQQQRLMKLKESAYIFAVNEALLNNTSNKNNLNSSPKSIASPSNPSGHFFFSRRSPKPGGHSPSTIKSIAPPASNFPSHPVSNSPSPSNSPPRGRSQSPTSNGKQLEKSAAIQIPPLISIQPDASKLLSTFLPQETARQLCFDTRRMELSQPLLQGSRSLSSAKNANASRSAKAEGVSHSDSSSSINHGALSNQLSNVISLLSSDPTSSNLNNHHAMGVTSTRKNAQFASAKALRRSATMVGPLIADGKLSTPQCDDSNLNNNRYKTRVPVGHPGSGSLHLFFGSPRELNSNKHEFAAESRYRMETPAYALPLNDTEAEVGFKRWRNRLVIDLTSLERHITRMKADEKAQAAAKRLKNGTRLVRNEDGSKSIAGPEIPSTELLASRSAEPRSRAAKELFDAARMMKRKKSRSPLSHNAATNRATNGVTVMKRAQKSLVGISKHDNSVSQVMDLPKLQSSFDVTHSEVKLMSQAQGKAVFDKESARLTISSGIRPDSSNSNDNMSSMTQNLYNQRNNYQISESGSTLNLMTASSAVTFNSGTVVKPRVRQDEESEITMLAQTFVSSVVQERLENQIDIKNIENEITGRVPLLQSEASIKTNAKFQLPPLATSTSSVNAPLYLNIEESSRRGDENIKTPSEGNGNILN